MRIAILADIHGNLVAFEAALEHATKQRPDLLIIAGDLVVGSPDSAACWRLAQSLGCPVLRGNHERYTATFDRADVPPLWRSEQFGPVRYAFEQFSVAERAAMDALPLHFRLAEYPDLLIVHSSLRNDRDMLVAYTPEHEIAAMFPHVSEHVIVRAHNHVPAVRLWERRVIVTTGSVGLPLDLNPTAQYLLLDRVGNTWHVAHQSVRYDLDAAVQRFREGYLEQAGPIAYLYLREVATASGQIVPFLRFYERWSAVELVTLEAAVHRFLHEL